MDHGLSDKRIVRILSYDTIPVAVNNDASAEIIAHGRNSASYLEGRHPIKIGADSHAHENARHRTRSPKRQ